MRSPYTLSPKLGHFGDYTGALVVIIPGKQLCTSPMLEKQRYTSILFTGVQGFDFLLD